MSMRGHQGRQLTLHLYHLSASIALRVIDGLPPASALNLNLIAIIFIDESVCKVICSIKKCIGMCNSDTKLIRKAEEKLGHNFHRCPEIEANRSLQARASLSQPESLAVI